MLHTLGAPPQPVVRVWAKRANALGLQRMAPELHTKLLHGTTLWDAMCCRKELLGRHVRACPGGRKSGKKTGELAGPVCPPPVRGMEDHTHWNRTQPLVFASLNPRIPSHDLAVSQH